MRTYELGVEYYIELSHEDSVRIAGELGDEHYRQNYPGLKYVVLTEDRLWRATGPKSSLLELKYDLEKKRFADE